MILSRRKMSCRELVELVTDYLDDALPGRERRRFERHLKKCQWCERYLEQIREVVRTLGRLTEETIPPRARDELLVAFRDWHSRP
jgi:anti-sigma factor RsiW